MQSRLPLGLLSRTRDAQSRTARWPMDQAAAPMIIFANEAAAHPDRRCNRRPAEVRTIWSRASGSRDPRRLYPGRHREAGNRGRSGTRGHLLAQGRGRQDRGEDRAPSKQRLCRHGGGGNRHADRDHADDAVTNRLSRADEIAPTEQR